MRAVWLADVLRDAGLTIKPLAGWEIRGSESFDPVGLVWHHTVTKASRPDHEIDAWMGTSGSSSVPPPLCNYSTNRDGTVSIIAAGRANHAGVGIWKGISGNARFLGDEMKNIGTSAEPWPERQLESARRAAAAVLNHLGRNADWLCAHREYATPAGRKTDPHSLNMNTERTVVERLRSNSYPTQEDLMTVSTWAQASWDKAKARGLITDDSIPKAEVTVEQLMVFLNRAGALDPPAAGVDAQARSLATEATQALARIKSVL